MYHNSHGADPSCIFFWHREIFPLRPPVTPLLVTSGDAEMGEIDHRDIVLLPVCAGAAIALGKVLAHGYGADTVWVPLLAGAACWVVIFLLLPKPMWIYVFGHELTHALWTWLFGGEVRKMKVTSKGGHVLISKTNFLIALAPYFSRCTWSW